jgi:hypothetical protein
MSRIFLPAVNLIPSDEKVIIIKLPDVRQVQEVVKAQLQRWEEAKKRYFRVEIKLPFSPVTTGERSQMNRIYGHCAWISMITGNDLETVKMFFKRKSMSAGYPFDVMMGEKDEEGMEVPWSLARISTQHAAILCNTIQVWAAQEGIPLPEYADDGSVVLV